MESRLPDNLDSNLDSLDNLDNRHGRHGGILHKFFSWLGTKWRDFSTNYDDVMREYYENRPPIPPIPPTPPGMDDII